MFTGSVGWGTFVQINVGYIRTVQMLPMRHIFVSNIIILNVCIYRIMPRIYQKKETSKTGHVNDVSMESAKKEVVDKTLSIRKSAAKYGIKPSTLESRLEKFRNYYK